MVIRSVVSVKLLPELELVSELLNSDFTEIQCYLDFVQVSYKYKGLDVPYV